MSSLWTPYGEQPIDDDRPGEPAGGAPGPPPGAPPEPDAELDPEQMREMLARLASTPVEMIVAQIAVQLQEVAVLHLGLAPERPESLAQAALAIDAFASLAEGLGERLEPNAEALRQVLAQLRIAFVEVAQQVGEGPPADEAPPAE